MYIISKLANMNNEKYPDQDVYIFVIQGLRRTQYKNHVFGTHPTRPTKLWSLLMVHFCYYMACLFHIPNSLVAKP
jgi:hypothetical protein